ncbi:MAG: FAD-dependent oxidoreductase [Acidobacteriota bacterium]
MSRIAVIGSGISGLTAAWLLSRDFDVLLLERADRLGGHTHTHHLDTPDGPLALDTGFLVHNDRTYPRLVRLFNELGIARLDSDMSFGVTCPRTGFEYSTRSLNGLFAQRSNLLRPSHYALLAEILRFNRASQRFAAITPSDEATSLGDWLDARRFSDAFLERFLFPLAASIWSASIATLRAFPALMLIRFFDQHGMNTTLNHPTWKVVAGGSATYIPKLLASPRIEARTGVTIESVTRTADAVTIAYADRPSDQVSQIVFATHGDEVLPMLTDATVAERDVLSAFHTNANRAVLHTDSRWLPRRAAARAAWNYQLGATSTGATVTYHLNRLQRLETGRDYCVTLNPQTAIAAEQVICSMDYTHPLYTRQAVQAQARWAEISGVARAHFCGAYWFYGFHEDGLRSAVRVAESLGVRW